MRVTRDNTSQHAKRDSIKRCAASGAQAFLAGGRAGQSLVQNSKRGCTLCLVPRAHARRDGAGPPATGAAAARRRDACGRGRGEEGHLSVQRKGTRRTPTARASARGGLTAALGNPRAPGTGARAGAAGRGRRVHARARAGGWCNASFRPMSMWCVSAYLDQWLRAARRAHAGRTFGGVAWAAR
ncbi:MAG: hypothetical protein J3K34DRAFT_416564 [Monoraphidium minutum]|nr:MAG: hypothetical protein J3K34DRAFT_416564 [Monoraphidium minutum]